jgi:hypothetical protein
MLAAGVVHEVRRVGGHERGLLSVHEPGDIFIVCAVTAEKAVVAEQPEKPRLRDGLGLRFSEGGVEVEGFATRLRRGRWTRASASP